MQFMFASGVLFIIVTIAVALFKTEDEPLEGIPGVFGAPLLTDRSTHRTALHCAEDGTGCPGLGRMAERS